MSGCARGVVNAVDNAGLAVKNVASSKSGVLKPFIAEHSSRVTAVGNQSGV